MIGHIRVFKIQIYLQNIDILPSQSSKYTSHDQNQQNQSELQRKVFLEILVKILCKLVPVPSFAENSSYTYFNIFKAESKWKPLNGSYLFS